ncbi:hypothetical protein A3A39_04540 [Candidatus Kaiserbacteria bacterium RIFCSPLOWO2_01_FULL_54_13]|uniref:Glycosyltransferase 2-like domain-containing protein n=1 Tax=Candidatus Kaiserbacteria bacterium RIFCSPLOWO2_01_FULL_54_13 TaxID=1798512 RepID=A0A1F6F1M9_9BACT|nr:MAG: hypothetical protein A3A39_04540 [Candidatus Kaiserbacteria bacterium RIFCSPLOWO2_01_FULL_54_13]
MISIVIPTLNERKHIGNLLDSILTQKLNEPVEVIIADAHSSDGTRELVESYGDRIPVRVVEGGVPPVARNRGARASRGNTLLFVDADATFPDASFLRENFEFFRTRKLGIAAAQLIPRSGLTVDHIIFGIGNLLLRILQWVRPVGSLCMMVSRDVFERANGYPEDRLLCEEHDFVEKAVRFSRYGLLPRRVIVSVRRFNKEGRLTALSKYTYASLYRVFVGPITKPIFRYEFTYADRENT